MPFIEREILPIDVGRKGRIQGEEIRTTEEEDTCTQPEDNYEM